ncbi:MAG: phenylalanine--tRNA ligase subunit alpha [Alphaproteobacteria bacterium]|nr:phenylalanine--tRNA ligase subunit alpha [Alphaproteobacteria bacterium]
MSGDTQKQAGQLETKIVAAIDATTDATALEAVRVGSLGKKGSVSALLKTLGGMSAEERQLNGPLFNALRDKIAEAIAAKKTELDAAALNARLAEETMDMTLPVDSDPQFEGRIHPVSQVMEELSAIFADMGFDVAEGPDIESQFYNFSALNIPEAHPARQMHDTFYLKAEEDGDALVLRTHTSPVQVRTMQQGQAEKSGPPFRFIAPGRTYRCDSDQTHTPMFHQIEGLVVDESTHMGHLKHTLETFLAAFFELDDIAIRFRPSYFPFTEPSMEIDMQCHRDGERLVVGSGDEWMEIGGSGMVNPHVLRHAGIDADKYQGFAFGMGIDRLAMLKYGAPDLRAFFEADLRWLKHYGFLPIDVPGLAAGLSNKTLANINKAT